MLRMVLVFGIAAEIPLVVILLNRIGVVRARQLAGARSWTILGIFVFAAIATPSTDPLTMLFLAVPMTGCTPSPRSSPTHRPEALQGSARGDR